MNQLITRVAVAMAFATLALAACSIPPLPEEEMQEPTTLPYEYLYGCLWTVTDLSDENKTLPSGAACREGALFFQENSETAYIFQRRPDLEELTGREKVFSIISQCNYTIDDDNREITLSDGEKEFYFHVERLNDRTLTLYYGSDPEAYIAYSRCVLSSITIAR